LLSIVSQCLNKTSRDLVDSIVVELDAFRGDTPPTDDMTAVAIKITA
jgi:serine phosphatase RsbU (regulator of sigma subunit)